MYTFLENMFKVLKVAANNEQQKDLAALAICANNLEAIAVLQRLHQYCLNIGDLKHAKEIQQEIVRCQNEISQEVLEKVLGSCNNTWGKCSFTFHPLNSFDFLNSGCKGKRTLTI